MTKKLTINELTNIFVIELDQIYLRAIKKSDYLDLYEYGKDAEVTKWLTWESFKSIDDAKNAIRDVFLSRPKKGIPSAYAIVIRQTDKMIGTCDFHTINWETATGEIGYCLNRAYWGRGYVTKACQAVVKFGFDYLKLKTITISYEKGNTASQRVIEKCGFTYIKDVYDSKTNKVMCTYKLEKNF